MDLTPILTATITATPAVAGVPVAVPFIVNMIQMFPGLVLPPVIDLVNQYVSNKILKFWVSMLICLVVAGILNFDKIASGNWAEFLGIAGFIFTQAQAVYKTYWSESRARISVYGRGILS